MLPATVAAGSLVAVPIDTVMVSLGLKAVPVDVSFMSGPTALPSSTVVTEAVAATGAGAGAGAGAGSLMAGGATASSFFLQPTMATLPITATSRAWVSLLWSGRVRFMGWILGAVMWMF